MNAADLCSSRHGRLGAVAHDEQAGRCYLSPVIARRLRPLDRPLGRRNTQSDQTRANTSPCAKRK